jgi:teichuronic acid biosynthesis glycosyltransferase TuaG
MGGHMARDAAVSIIMPSYNTARFLRDTVESVVRQTFQDWELLAADDHSTDDSLDILSEFKAREPRIRVLSLGQHLGPAGARNAAIHAARGSYIAFLDSDDLWLPHKLERHIAFMKDAKSPLSYTAYRKIHEDDSLGGLVSVPPTVDYDALLYSNCIGCSTAIYDTTRLGKVFFPDIARRQDHGLWLKILKKGFRADGLNDPLTLYRVRKQSVSSNKLVAAAYQWKLYRRVEGLSLPSTLLHFVGYAYRGVRKVRL